MMLPNTLRVGTLLLSLAGGSFTIIFFAAHFRVGPLPYH